MRTTLAIDDDVLAAVKSLAARKKKSVGEVLSALARKSLRPKTAKNRMRNGVPLLPVYINAAPVTLEVINRLRDETA